MSTTKKMPDKISGKIHDASSKPMPFASDIEAIRQRAREHMECGAVTSDYEGDVQTAISILNDALATEIVCTLRYMNHYHMAKGIHSEAVKDEFLEHSREEQRHAFKIAERIVQLGGNPEMNPAGLATRSHAEYQEADDLNDMIREDLIAERIAIESYREMVNYFAKNDPTSRRLMEKILAKEEEHAEDMGSLLQTLGAVDVSKKSSSVA
jgi:bacterioferritin